MTTEHLPLEIDLQSAPPERGMLGRIGAGLRKFARVEPAGVVAAVAFLIVVGAVVVGPMIEPHDPIDISPRDKFIGPGFGTSHWLGTDQLGRDVLSRALTGGRVSLFNSFGALALGIGAGAALGLVAGFFAHWTGEIVQRVMDGLMAVPPLILGVTLATALGNETSTVLLAISVVMLPTVYRVVRGATLSVREADYVTAATVIGASSPRILARHIVPNVTGTIITLASVWIGNVILIEAALGFLGIGTQPPDPSWGNMLASEGRAFMTVAPWMAIVPGVFISVTVLTTNILGDSLRLFLEPKARGRI